MRVFFKAIITVGQGCYVFDKLDILIKWYLFNFNEPRVVFLIHIQYSFTVLHMGLLPLIYSQTDAS
jgi:hypothetical protein